VIERLKIESQVAKVDIYQTQPWKGEKESYTNNNELNREFAWSKTRG
jgi:hypothetical protein